MINIFFGENMHRHWEKTILPLIEKLEPKHIVEIGSDTGINTNNILRYCEKNNCKLTSIDPKPNFDVDKLKEKYNGKFDFYFDLSLKILPFLEKFDVILIDGDHNWYTVFNELKTIENIYKKNNNYPLILFHDVAWPYARRDLYYNPETIPEEYLLPYDTLGMIPYEKGLSKDKGLNHGFNNALFEGGEKNGVLTAIEDYIDASSLNLLFYSIPAYNGLGILFLENDDVQRIVDDVIDYPNIIEDLEKHYLKTISSDIQSEKNRLIKVIDEKSIELIGLRNEKASLQDIIVERDNSINVLNGEKASLQDIIVERDENNLLKDRNQSLSKTKVKLEDKYQSQIKKLVDEKLILQQNNKKKDDVIQELNNEKRIIMDFNDEKDSIISDLTSKNDSLLERSTLLTRTKKELQEDYELQIKATSDLESQIEIMNTKLSDFICINNKQSRELHDLRNMIKCQKDIIDNNNKKIQEYESSYIWKITKLKKKILNKFKSNNT